MNILFLTLLDFSSINDSNIYTDLLREFVKNGHKVYIISPVERKNHQDTSLINEDGCSILKLKVGNIQKTNLIEKGISTLTIESKFLGGIKKYFANVKFDLVMYSTPPITLQKAVAYVKKRDSAKTYLLLKDIFPQNAVDLGIMNKRGLKGFIYKYFRLKEKKLYEFSDYIGCMSQANVRFLLRNNSLTSQIVEVCPNSIEPLKFILDEETKREIRKKYNIPLDKVVLIYGGNLGKPQGVDFIIECLKANRNNNLVYFMIVGSGTEFNRLYQFINGENLINAQLLAQLAKEDYELLVNACDVGLIYLDRRFTIPNFPSRILSYMQASMPVLAATDVNTDIGEVIENGKFGFWCESGDIDGFNRNLQKICDENLRKQMGEQARLYLENNYTAKHSYEIIMRHFS